MVLQGEGTKVYCVIILDISLLVFKVIYEMLTILNYTIWPFRAELPVFVPVQVSDGDDLSSYIVVKSVHRAGVDETVSHPESSLHNLLDLSLDL